MSILSLQEASQSFEDCHVNIQNLGMMEALYAQGLNLASEHLTDLLGTPFNLSLGDLHLFPFDQIVGVFQNDQRFQVGIHSRITGDLRGDIYLFLAKNAAHRLVQIGFKRRGLGSLFLSKLEESFLNEFANILFNAFWQAFNDKAPFRWWLSPPKTLNRPGYSIALNSRVYARDRMAFWADFVFAEPKLRGVLFFLPTEDSLDLFLKYLR